MDLRMERQHLGEAEQHIALGERHIARQIEIITELQLAGHDTRLAADVLETYRDVQASHTRHRERILEALEQGT